jgi:hypothetical protein
LKGQVSKLAKSGLSRRAFCKQNSLNVHSLDYWSTKLKRSQAASRQRPRTEKRWVTLQVADQPASGTGIRLRIGRLTIELDPGFNRNLLTEVIKIAASAC